MGGLLAIVAVLLHGSLTVRAWSPPTPSSMTSLRGVERRQTTAQRCDAASKVCYVECTTKPNNPVFRLAIADGGAAAPFDVLLQMIVPASLGWAGFAWGGVMIDNPLTVAWPNGNNKVTVTSRWATGRTVPGAYNDAKLTTLGSSRNATHWTVEVLCSGCSKWRGSPRGLSPADVNTFAWAVSRSAVPQPASNSSSFPMHTNMGNFPADLRAGRTPKAAFQAYVAAGGKAS